MERRACRPSCRRSRRRTGSAPAPSLGRFSTAEALAQGHAAGIAATGAPETPVYLPDVSAHGLDPRPAPVFEIKAKGKAFVDFQHDVTADDVRLAHREGYVSVEHLKRYTTLGMATDQGKTSNVPGLAIMADALGSAIDDVGTTRFRAPFSPVSLGSLAAERYGDLKPERLTPMHDWHVEQGAVMYAAGLWFRPMIYGQPGESVEQAYVREARAVRDGAGIVDVSTLGKIAVQGPDAAAFLDRVYTNMFSTLAVGKARYGLMLREDGIALDDGTTWRLGDNDFLMTTTTANAGKVMQHLEYFLDVVWPDLKVHLTSVTDEWAGAAIGGPEGARHPRRLRHRRRRRQRRPALHGHRAWRDSRRAGHDLPALLLRRDGVRGLLRRRPRHPCLERADRGRQAVRHGALRAGGARHAAHREGPRHRRRDRRPHHGARPASRLDAVEEEAVRRLDDHGPRRPGRQRAHRAGRRDLARQPPARRRRAYRRTARRGRTHEARSATSAPPAIRRRSASYIALALVKGGKSRHGTRAFVSDPLRKRFGPVEIVSHHFFDPDGSRMHG